MNILKKILSVKNMFLEKINNPKTLGYLKFSYSIERFKTNIHDDKYSVNIGDYVQSFCVKSLIKKLFPNEKLITVDRDTLQTAKNKPAKLFCNGVFYANTMPKFPIKPIYLGLSLANDPNLLEETIENLKLNEPIGCRDIYTKKLLKNMVLKLLCPAVTV